MKLSSKALEFIDSMESASSAEKVSDILVNAFDVIGFDSVAALKLPGPNEVLEETMLVNTRSSDFAADYYESQFDRCDPVLEQFAADAYAYTWSSAYAGCRDPDRLAVLKLAQDYNMREGVVIPIFQLGHHGMVSAATSRNDITKEQFQASYLVGMSGYCRMMALRTSCQPRFKPLHSRESQCLQWVAVGKSDRQIADITGLSHNTVRNYIESAKTHLGAPNRTAAAVIALRAGLIHL